jgi:hypothetical protein
MRIDKPGFAARGDGFTAAGFVVSSDFAGVGAGARGFGSGFRSCADRRAGVSAAGGFFAGRAGDFVRGDDLGVGRFLLSDMLR